MTDEATKELFLSLRPALTRFLAARGLGTDEAQDAVQDLFLKLDGMRLEGIADPRAYLYRAADNLVLDRRRSALRRLNRETRWGGLAAPIGPGIDPQPSIETLLIDRERLTAVADALAALPDRTADIFRRFRLLGEPQRDIAGALGISLSAVEKHLQRAYATVVDARRRIDADFTHPRGHSPGGESDAA